MAISSGVVLGFKPYSLETHKVANDSTVRRIFSKHRIARENEASYLRGIGNFCEYLGSIKPEEALRWIKAVKLVRYDIRVHSLRKCFETQYSVHWVDRMTTEAMIDHSLRSFESGASMIIAFQT